MKRKKSHTANPKRHVAGIGLILFFFLQGCAAMTERASIKDIPGTFGPGTIISTETGSPISYDDLISRLNRVRIIYVGEKHTDAAHHDIQLRIIRDIYTRNRKKVMVGMEMFDRTYQPVLDQWSAGKLDWKTFLQRTHWYANWKMDDRLYADILAYIRTHHIPLIGLNIPFHIPPKIAVGGIQSLSDEDKRYLPKKIDTSNAEHRQYVRKIFDHHHVMGMDTFEYFYEAQCVWDDIMAETIAANIGDRKMIVLAGNGHIIRKFGIPNRAFKRTGDSFKTLYLAPPGSDVERSFADYIWLTPVKKDKTQK